MRPEFDEGRLLRMASPLEVFCCYAREDQEMLKQLKKHLASLERGGQIKLWSDTDLNAGVEWEQELHTHLERADLILLLISPDFMNSDYCYSIEMGRAIERHEQGSARVVPIILRATYWRDAPFARLQVLPKDARAVKSWPDLDEALNDVTEQLVTVLADLRSRSAPPRPQAPAQPVQPRPAPAQPRPVAPGRTKEEWVTVGNSHLNAGRFTEALVAFEQAIHLDATFALAYINKGVALENLKRYAEALAAHERALRLDSTNALAYYNKGVALVNLNRREEALTAYEQALLLDPTNAQAHQGKGVTLGNLNRYAEALPAFEQVLPKDARAVKSWPD
ncbi:MAG TPA: tetratricopeptide repeat protein, partial [Ktedonobacteraceae bacterium]